MSSDSSSSSVTGSASGSESDTEGSSKCSWESKEGESEEEENEDELASHELPVVAPAPVEQVQEVYKEEEHYDYQYPIAEVFERFKRKDKNLLLAMERPRLMPSASKEHQEIIERLLEDNYIRTNSVYNIMKKIDFKLFYKVVTETWTQTCATMLENVKEAITDGDDVLSFPLNMYFNVCLCFLVGEKGSVTCFGHTANWTWLEKAGLRWLDTDDRLMFINDENTSLPIPYADFIEEGFEIRQPYDTLILADNSLPRVPLHVRSQLKPNAICFQPSSNTYFNLEEAPPIIPQPAPLVYH